MKLKRMNFQNDTLTFEQMTQATGGAGGYTITKSTGCTSTGTGSTDCGDGDAWDEEKKQ